MLFKVMCHHEPPLAPERYQIETTFLQKKTFVWCFDDGEHQSNSHPKSSVKGVHSEYLIYLQWKIPIYMETTVATAILLSTSSQVCWEH